MRFENSQDDWEINLDPKIKNIGLKISGGADSAIVCYMLAKYVIEERNDITIHPVTGVASTKAYQQIFADKVLRKVEQLTGITFAKHQYKMIRSDTSENYISDQEEFVTSFVKQKLFQLRFSGVTANPEPEDAPELYDGTPLPGSYGENDLDRNKGIVKKVNTKRPLINCDKKGVAEHYVRLGVLEDIYPLTRSCEQINITDFSKHCETCWFCKERYWGFGRYI